MGCNAVVYQLLLLLLLLLMVVMVVTVVTADGRLAFWVSGRVCCALEQLTTVAWNEDKQLLCHAHSKGVKFDIKHNFEEVGALCDARARKQWIQVRVHGCDCVVCG